MKNPLLRLAFANLVFAFAAICLLTRCAEEPVSKNARVKVDSNSLQGTIIPYSFNWEPPTDYMPSPPGTSILVPWASNTNQGFPQEVRYDYKASDGWVLVYNTFSPSGIVNPKSFILYNKFRGLLRFYLYVDAYNAPAPGDYILNELSLETANGATSNMLNFSAADLLRQNHNYQVLSQIIPYRVNATSGWYAFQHEVAYDPTIASQVYQNINLRWSARSVSVSQIELDGHLDGSIKTPTSKPSKTNIFNNVGQGAISLTGLAVLDNNPNMLKPMVLNAVKGALTSGFQGVIKNVFNAVFGGDSNSPQVDLKLTALMDITGSETTNSGLMDNIIVIPGVSNSQTTSGFAPLYNHPLGVFYISNTPVIKYKATFLPDPYGSTDYRRFSLSVDANSFQYQFNPAVTSSATITNIKRSIVALNPGLYDYSNGAFETVGDLEVKTGVTYINDYVYNPPQGDFALRISFDVVPNNGAPKATIIKTFRARLEQG